MAPYDEIYSELNKLRKEYLVEIIITKKVPQNANVSEQVRNYIEQSETTANCTIKVNSSDVSPKQQLELEVTKVELRAAKELVTEKEKVILYQKEVIDLIKANNSVRSVKSEVVCTNNNSVSQAALGSDVAKQTNNSRVAGNANNQQRVVTRNTDATKNTKNDNPSTSTVGVRKPNGNKIDNSISTTDKRTIGTKKDNDNESLDFRAAARRAWLHVARVNKETTADKVKQYLQNKFKQDFVVENLPVRDDANSISFKVGADIELLDQLLDANTWPENIVVRRFRFFRRPAARFDTR